MITTFAPLPTAATDGTTIASVAIRVRARAMAGLRKDAPDWGRTAVPRQPPPGRRHAQCRHGPDRPRTIGLGDGGRHRNDAPAGIRISRAGAPRARRATDWRRRARTRSGGRHW